MQQATTSDLTALLEQHFGYAAFRPLQEEIIGAVLSGKNCLTVMPTGSGKSLCFQLPALCMDGVTLVVSPLIALMKDQVDSLRANGIAAEFLNSSQTAAEQRDVQTEVQAGNVRLLYVAPERLALETFRTFLSSVQVSLIAIDEAHCISEWGHEFRPDYRNLKTLRATFPSVPCIALTATATPKVREDIRQQLDLLDATEFLSSFNRDNLTYHVYPKQRSFERLLVALREPQRLPAIVYCFSRKDTEALAEDLRAEGFACAAYHAGLDPAVRRKAQEALMRDEVQIMTATIAFGMGIDKPDIRTVVHMDLPKNVEGYYQETGRAGRDGLPSDCILFFSYGDKFRQEYFIDRMEDPVQQALLREKLDLMLRYGNLRTCRRAYLLRYFGEEDVADACEGCDCCLRQDELFDATVVAQKILSTVIRTGGRFGMSHVIDILTGRSTQRVLGLGHGNLSVFNSVQDYDGRELREIITALIDDELLARAEGKYPTLSVTEAGRVWLMARSPLRLRKPEESVHVRQRKGNADDVAFDPALFEELRTLRRGIAQERKVAAYVVFGDRSLREMAAYLPQQPESFMRIYGVSDRKLEQFGEQFLALIRSFAKEHGLEERAIPATRTTDSPRRERPSRMKNATYQETLALLQQGLLLPEIASKRNLKTGTIVQHIEQLVLAGADISVDHLKPPAAIFDPIAEAFAKHGTEALSPVFHQFDGAYTYDQIQLVRMFLRMAALRRSSSGLLHGLHERILLPIKNNAGMNGFERSVMIA